MPASISVRVNPTSLAVGTYSASVVVTVSGVTTPATIPVSLVVSSPPPNLTITPASLTLSTTPIAPLSQSVALGTTGGPISFTASAAGVSWLTIAPPAGIILPGAPASLSVNIDPSALSPQSAPYTGRITIATVGAATKSQTISISVTINAVTPTITSLWPAGVQVGSPDTVITIRGTNFYGSTLAKITGVTTALKTTVISSTALQAIIPAAQLTAPATLNLVVSNPAPGGDSASVPFTVSSSPVIQAAVNVASYAGATLAPGELVTLFGANIGPLAASTMAITNGFVATSLGGVSVAVDGQPAPVIYVSQNQVTIQIPYEVTQGAGKNITVINGTNTATGTVNIGANAPGIFTADGSGAGQAAALNFSATTSQYSLNSQANPARPGDTLLLYLTGEGDYATSVFPRTGLVVPSTLSPLPQVSPLPVVTIGGATATVAYAGPVVGSIMGVLQINAVVPTGSTTGAAVPLVITIGGTAVQNNVTLSIHP